MRVRAGGLSLDHTVPGMLHAWARTNQGDWLGYCTFTVTTSNGHGYMEVTQWCPSGAITPK